MKRMLKLQLALAAGAVALVIPASATSHPFGMCHVTPSGNIILKQGAAANAHHRLMLEGVHAEDYEATAADVAYAERIGKPRCVGSK